MYKSAFLGCGPRARGHAKSYEFVKKGRIAAICDMNKDRLNAFGNDFGVEKRYTDVHEMLDKERPDVLDIVTPPTVRVELMAIAAEHEVPVVIVEKPVALQAEDSRQMKELNDKCRTNFVVNTQLHFHARNMELKRDVAEGRIGEVRFIEATARSPIFDQGVHVLELAYAFNGCVAPTSVMGQVGGTDHFSSNHPAPDIAEAVISFKNGVQTQLLCGSIAPKLVDSNSIYAHKRTAVYGSRGFVHWTMYGWERNTIKGGYESGTHDYAKEDDPAQAKLIDAAFDWAEDESKLHPTRLELSLVQFNALLGVYVSALEYRTVELPFDAPDGLIDALKSRLLA